jgi:hypothetical protein
MKAIKLLGNKLLIIAALERVNVRCVQHTFDDYDVYNLAIDAERQALALLGSIKAIIGTKANARSGKKLPNAYKYARRVNTITLERRASGWWLTELANVESSDKRATELKLTLTAAQDTIAIDRLRKGYTIA